jgi:hypothetical protein
MQIGNTDDFTKRKQSLLKMKIFKEKKLKYSIIATLYHGVLRTSHREGSTSGGLWDRSPCGSGAEPLSLAVLS